MIEVNIKVDLSALDKAADIFRRGFGVNNLVETAGAVEAGGKFIQSEWVKYVSGSTVTYSGGSFVIKKVSGQYADAVLGGRRYPMDGNPLKTGVEVNLDYAEKLERGFDPFDEKTGLLNGPKVKWTADGKPYVNVMFQHEASGIPGAIKSEITRKGTSLGLIRTGVGRDSAPAGIRSSTTVTSVFPNSEGYKTGYTWKAGMFTDMVRGQAGPEKRGQYMTFRRVSEASDPRSWIHPGITPKPVTKALQENTSAELTKLVSLGFQRDVNYLSRLAGLGP